MKIQNLSVIAFALLCSLGFQTALAAEECNASLFAGGIGKRTNPYKISTPQELQNLNECLGESHHYVLTSDIVLSGDWQPIGKNSSHPFSGKLDGKGHKVLGLKINSFSEDRVGLFGYVSSGAELKNIVLEIDGTVRGLNNVGGLVGENWGKIIDSYVSGNVSGNEHVGLIAGYNYGTISGSYVTGNVFGNQYVGSLAGYNNEGTVSDCYANTAVVLGSNYVGGLAGYNKIGSKIKNSYFVGSVTPVTATCALVDGEPVVTCHPTEKVASVADFRTTYSYDGYTISASNVVCDGVIPKNKPTCGTIIVEPSSSSEEEESSSSIEEEESSSSIEEESSSSSVLVIVPACFIEGCYISSGSTVNVPPPTYSCGESVIASGAKFSLTSGNHANISSNAPNNWNDSYTAHGISTSTGTDRDVYMWNIACDGEQALPNGVKDTKDEALVIKCGTIHTVKTEADCPAGSTIMSSSSVNSSSSVAGATEPSSSATGETDGTCAYQSSWCEGKTPTPNTTTKPGVGECVFVKTITHIRPASGGGTILINGDTCNKVSTECDTKSVKDGGYYVYLKSGSFSSNLGWEVTAGAPTCGGSTDVSSSSSTASTPSQFTPVTLALNPGNSTDELNFNWYSGTGTGTDKTFVRLFKNEEHIGDFKGDYNAASSGNRQHKATVTALESSTVYKYQVSNDSISWSQEYEFITPSTNGNFTFAAISDIQPSCGNSSECPEASTGSYTGIGPWKAIAAKIKAAGATLIVNAGDHAEYGYETEFRSYFSPPELRSIPTAPVMGNHDWKGQSTNSTFEYHFNLPNLVSGMKANYNGMAANYYFLYNRVLFIGLNTAPYPGGLSNTNFETAKAAAPPYIEDFTTTIDAAKNAYSPLQYDFIVVTYHKSTNSVTSSSAGHEDDPDVRAYVAVGLQRLMTEKGVDLVFSGHNHIYVRSKLMYNDRPSEEDPETEGKGTYYMTLKPAGITRNYAGATIGWTNSDRTNFVSVYPFFTRELSNGRYAPVSYYTHSQYGKTTATNGDLPGYSIIEVNNGVMTIKSYEQDGTTVFDEFEIRPTLPKYSEYSEYQE
ncbi:hypothetical protein R83H12_01638 [Fibrobacteria bacterium R8-3-H12]